MTEHFDYMFKDKLLTRVYFDLSKSKIVGFENYTNDLLDRFFGQHSLEDLCWEDLMCRLENRCFSRYRPDRDDILEELGCSSTYNVWDIISVTRGILSSDFYWIKFEWREEPYETAYREAHLNRKSIKVDRG